MDDENRETLECIFCSSFFTRNENLSYVDITWKRNNPILERNSTTKEATTKSEKTTEDSREAVQVHLKRLKSINRMDDVR